MIDRRAYLNAAYPPPLHLPGEQPRTFVLHWNSRKAKGSRRRADEWQECQGVLFTAHDALARVALSNGQTFPTLDELEHIVGLGGDYRIDWQDEA